MCEDNFYHAAQELQKMCALLLKSQVYFYKCFRSARVIGNKARLIVLKQK